MAKSVSELDPWRCAWDDTRRCCTTPHEPRSALRQSTLTKRPPQIRPPQRGQPVDHVHSDHHLPLLCRRFPRPKCVTDDSFVPVHPVLGSGLLMGTSLLPPLATPHLGDPCDRHISLVENPIRRHRGSGGPPRWDHDYGFGRSDRSKRLVDRPRVIRPVGCEPTDDRLVPPDPRGADGRTVHRAVGQLRTDDEALGVHGEVEFAPGSSLVRGPVFVGMPLAVAHDLQPRRVDGEVERFVTRPGKYWNLDCATTARQNGVIRRLQAQTRHTDQRRQEALGLAEREV